MTFRWLYQGLAEPLDTPAPVVVVPVESWARDLSQPFRLPRSHAEIAEAYYVVDVSNEPIPEPEPIPGDGGWLTAYSLPHLGSQFFSRLLPSWIGSVEPQPDVSVPLIVLPPADAMRRPSWFDWSLHTGPIEPVTAEILDSWRPVLHDLPVRARLPVLDPQSSSPVEPVTPLLDFWLPSLADAMRPERSVLASFLWHTQNIEPLPNAVPVLSWFTPIEQPLFTEQLHVSQVPWLTQNIDPIANAEGTVTPPASVIVGVSTSYKLATQIDPSPCNEARERSNWNRLHKLLSVLDNMLDISVSPDGRTFTINISVNRVLVNETVVSPDYQDEAEVSICWQYCPTAIAQHLAGAVTDEMLGSRKREKRKRRESLVFLLPITASAIPP